MKYIGRLTGTAGVATIFLCLAVLLPSAPALGQGAGAEVKEKPIPPGVDVYDLNLDQVVVVGSGQVQTVVAVAGQVHDKTGLSEAQLEVVTGFRFVFDD